MRPQLALKSFLLTFVESLTASPISAIAWLSTGLVVATGSTLGFYSSKLDTGEDCHALANERIAPLPYHHPQLLYQSLLHGALTSPTASQRKHGADEREQVTRKRSSKYWLV